MHIPADILERPAAEAAHWLVLARLDDLDDASPGTGASMDADALHDFRVALRRLRSVLRSHRSVLDDTLSTKARRRLDDIADVTAPSRDADVHLLWLAGEKDTLASVERPAVRFLRRRLKRDKRASDRVLYRMLERRLAPTLARLRDEMSRYVITYQMGRTNLPARGADELRVVLDRLGAEFVSHHVALLDATGDRALHRFRIATKRLRYELEAVFDAIPPDSSARDRIQQCVERLKGLQDQLGDVHDAYVFGRWLADRAAESGAKRSRQRVLLTPRANAIVSRRTWEGDPEPGIAALEQRLHDRADAALRAARSAWLDEAVRELMEEIHAIAAAIGGLAGYPDPGVLGSPSSL